MIAGRRVSIMLISRTGSTPTRSAASRTGSEAPGVPLLTHPLAPHSPVTRDVAPPNGPHSVRDPTDGVTPFGLTRRRGAAARPSPPRRSRPVTTTTPCLTARLFYRGTSQATVVAGGRRRRLSKRRGAVGTGGRPSAASRGQERDPHLEYGIAPNTSPQAASRRTPRGSRCGCSRGWTASMRRASPRATDLEESCPACAVTPADDFAILTRRRMREPRPTAGRASIHRVLMAPDARAGIVGRVRTVQNWIGGNSYNPCGADFVPPPPEEVGPLLADLSTFCNDDTLSPLVQAAIAHAQFETIHPFADGNGRTGRALVQVILRRRQLAPSHVPPISVVLARHRERYIEGLAQFRADRFAGWVAIFAEATAAAALLAARYAERVARAAGDVARAAGPGRPPAFGCRRVADRRRLARAPRDHDERGSGGYRADTPGGRSCDQPAGVVRCPHPAQPLGAESQLGGCRPARPDRRDRCRRVSGFRIARHSVRRGR